MLRIWLTLVRRHVGIKKWKHKGTFREATNLWVCLHLTWHQNFLLNFYIKIYLCQLTIAIVQYSRGRRLDLLSWNQWMGFIWGTIVFCSYKDKSLLYTAHRVKLLGFSIIKTIIVQLKDIFSMSVELSVLSNTYITFLFSSSVGDHFQCQDRMMLIITMDSSTSPYVTNSPE
jgi:hypothetical protein